MLEPLQKPNPPRKPTPPKDPSPPRTESKGKDGQLTQEDVMAQLKEMKRLPDLKAENEKSEKSLKRIMNPVNIKAQAQEIAEYEAKRAKMLKEFNDCINQRADELPITKISYRVSSSYDVTMRITRGNDPLNVVVHDKFRLNTLGFSEWLKAQKLGVPPPQKLSTFGISADNKKRKRTSNLIKESFRESEFYLATTPQLIRTQSAILRNTPEAEEMYKRIEFAIVARDDAVEAKKIEKKTWMVLECTGSKGLAECKASASNLRDIQVKDIVKEVEDYLKTYSSVEMDISWPKKRGGGCGGMVMGRGWRRQVESRRKNGDDVEMV
ncbi:hypothetical protein Tco_0746739 [Tanacetum coccineum]